MPLTDRNMSSPLVPEDWNADVHIGTGAAILDYKLDASYRG